MEDSTNAAVAMFSKYAEKYEQQYMDVGLYTRALDVFCDGITTETPRILEVGCGPANITNYLTSKRPDFNILATDLSAEMLERAKQNNSTAKFQQLDLRKIDTLHQSFDGIVCGFCLPYLGKNEVETFVENAAKLLAENGLLYLSTMEAAFETSGFQKPSTGNDTPLYIHYYPAEYLTAVLVKNNFSIYHLSRKTYTDHHKNQVTDLLLIAQKK